MWNWNGNVVNVGRVSGNGVPLKIIKVEQIKKGSFVYMKKKKLSIIQEAVLAQIPRGLESPIRSRDIADRAGLSQREVMAVINALIINHGIAIGGGRSEGRYGYFIITNEEELQQATVPLKNSIINMQQRVDRLEKIKL